ncbi:MAG: hypothetical protein NTW86_17185 [Candidatus Sumerlaeota bacterium]|nr:hypothetical protein [Candidatus Sumerlaeota bacterium]
MTISTAEAARRLGVSVAEFLDAVVDLVGDLSDAWPQIDEGYVATVQQVRGILPLDKTSGQPQGPAERDDGAVSEEMVEELSPVQEAKLRILDKLERAGRWGGNAVSWDTLRNHYCHGVEGLEEGLKVLIDEDLVVVAERGTVRKGPFSLNPGEKGAIERQLARFRG